MGKISTLLKLLRSGATSGEVLKDLRSLSRPELRPLIKQGYRVSGARTAIRNEGANLVEGVEVTLSHGKQGARTVFLKNQKSPLSKASAEDDLTDAIRQATSAEAAAPGLEQGAMAGAPGLARYVPPDVGDAFGPQRPSLVQRAGGLRGVAVRAGAALGLGLGVKDLVEQYGPRMGTEAGDEVRAALKQQAVEDFYTARVQRLRQMMVLNEQAIASDMPHLYQELLLERSLPDGAVAFGSGGNLLEQVKAAMSGFQLMGRQPAGMSYSSRGGDNPSESVNIRLK